VLLVDCLALEELRVTFRMRLPVDQRAQSGLRTLGVIAGVVVRLEDADLGWDYLSGR
jgi:hypothetical protein